jgi:hypothetical protein
LKQGEEVGALAMGIEPALRELLVDERCYKVLPATARALVRAAASEAYNAGAKIFFSSPNATLKVLGPLLQRVLESGETEIERGMCSRCDFIICVCACMTCVCETFHGCCVGYDALKMQSCTRLCLLHCLDD